MAETILLKRLNRQIEKAQASIILWQGQKDKILKRQARPSKIVVRTLIKRYNAMPFDELKAEAWKRFDLDADGQDQDEFIKQVICADLNIDMQELEDALVVKRRKK